MIKLVIAILIIAFLGSVANSGREEVAEIFEKRDENMERISKFQKSVSYSKTVFELSSLEFSLIAFPI